MDFKTNEFVIPAWDKVKEFALYVCAKLHHCRLVQLDITVSAKGRLQLIEFNITRFSYWLFMYSGQRPFGSYTDKVIEYCKDKKVELATIL